MAVLALWTVLILLVRYAAVLRRQRSARQERSPQPVPATKSGI
jgi:preprotein translocase subunit YajC